MTDNRINQARKALYLPAETEGFEGHLSCEVLLTLAAALDALAREPALQAKIDEQDDLIASYHEGLCHTYEVRTVHEVREERVREWAKKWEGSLCSEAYAEFRVALDDRKPTP